MLNFFSNVSLGESPAGEALAPGLLAGAPGSPPVTADGGFAGLLSAETSMAGLLETLKGLLSAEDFRQLEERLAEGQSLPLTEIIAALQAQPAEGPPELAAALDAVAGPAAGGMVEPPQAMEQTTEQLTEQAVEQAAAQTAAPLAPELTAVPLPVVTAPRTLVAQAVSDKPRLPATSAAAPAPLPVEGVDEASGSSSAVRHGAGQNGPQAGMVPPPAAEPFRVMEAVAAQAARKIPLDGGLLRAVEAGGASPDTGASALPAWQGLSRPVAPHLPGPVGQPAPVYTALGEKGWDQAMGERILWMIGRRVQGAEVRITPPQLGPVDIRISIQHDQAHVSFTAQHGVVREALEASIPRLRELLNDNNLQLANVDVNSRNAGEERAASHAFGQSSSGGGRQGGEGYAPDESGAAADAVRVLRSDGLVDDFA